MLLPNIIRLDAKWRTASMDTHSRGGTDGTWAHNVFCFAKLQMDWRVHRFVISKQNNNIVCRWFDTIQKKEASCTQINNKCAPLKLICFAFIHTHTTTPKTPSPRASLSYNNYGRARIKSRVKCGRVSTRLLLPVCRWSPRRSSAHTVVNASTQTEHTRYLLYDAASWMTETIDHFLIICKYISRQCFFLPQIINIYATVECAAQPSHYAATNSYKSKGRVNKRSQCVASSASV